MAKTGVIRHRLLYILLLGVVTSALSLAALWRALMLSDSQRLERARDAVSGELDRIVQLAPSPEAQTEPARSTYIGLRGGWLDDAAAVARIEGLPEAWRPVLAKAVSDSMSRPRDGGAARVIVDAAVPGTTLIVGVGPASRGGYAWVGVLLAPSQYLKPWRQIALAILCATLLLVASTFAAVLSFRRQTRQLQSTLAALAKNLHTPVPRPTIAELAQLAEGIERMSVELLRSREDTERLQGELAQRERLTALGRVAAGVAHEVRNPLAAIKLRLDLTAATQALPPATQRAIAAASEEIARLDRLVGDLLVVAGRNPGPRVHLDLGALARARVETLTPWAETAGVAMRVSGDATAVADPESLTRAIDNLVRNAVEASPRGSVVEIEIHADASQATIEIVDAGIGVAAERQSQMFEPFFTTKPEGTGLGLALSRAIARAHGGDLVYTRQGDRTRFVLSLPLVARAAEAA